MKHECVRGLIFMVDMLSPPKCNVKEVLYILALLGIRHMEKSSKWMKQMNEEKIWNGVDKKNIQNKATNKTNLYIIIKLTLTIKNNANSINKIIVCIYVCVCVSDTTKLQKDYIFKMSFFLWLEKVGFSETGKSLIVNVYWRNECLRGLSMLLLFDVCWVTLEGVCCRCEEIG